MKVEDIPWDCAPDTAQERVYQQMVRAWAKIVPGAAAGKEVGSKGNLLRPGGRPLAETFPEILRQRQAAESAYLSARKRGRELGLLSRRHDPREKWLFLRIQIHPSNCLLAGW